VLSDGIGGYLVQRLHHTARLAELHHVIVHDARANEGRLRRRDKLKLIHVLSVDLVQRAVARPSSVRRQLSQSAGSGFSSRRASTTIHTVESPHGLEVIRKIPDYARKHNPPQEQ
jgi:hypothetical protein